MNTNTRIRFDYARPVPKADWLEGFLLAVATCVIGGVLGYTFYGWLWQVTP